MKRRRANNPGNPLQTDIVEDCWDLIFQFLEIPEVVRLKMVCRTLNDIVKNSLHWKRMCLRETDIPKFLHIRQHVARIPHAKDLGMKTKMCMEKDLKNTAYMKAFCNTLQYVSEKGYNGVAFNLDDIKVLDDKTVSFRYDGQYLRTATGLSYVSAYFTGLEADTMYSTGDKEVRTVLKIYIEGLMGDNSPYLFKSSLCREMQFYLTRECGYQNLVISYDDENRSHQVSVTWDLYP